jgi:DeoR/GlpR family transcriptional regulator of sugar metabolism
MTGATVGVVARTLAIALAVDHTKLGTRAQARTFRLDEIDVLVTDLDPDDTRLDDYRGADLEVV